MSYCEDCHAPTRDHCICKEIEQCDLIGNYPKGMAMNSEGELVKILDHLENWTYERSSL